jgi:hypothetical protein
MQRPSLRTCGALALSLLVLAGCSRTEPSGPAATLVASIGAAPMILDDANVLMLPDLMDLVVDPAAAVLFSGADRPTGSGYEPLADEAWQALADAAGELVRNADTLARSGLALGRADWLQWTAAMREGAAAGAAAARRHDPRNLWSASAQVRASCQACHARYAAAFAQRPTPSAAR